jgi:hypothetical protein
MLHKVIYIVTSVASSVKICHFCVGSAQIPSLIYHSARRTQIKEVWEQRGYIKKWLGKATKWLDKERG